MPCNHLCNLHVTTRVMLGNDPCNGMKSCRRAAPVIGPTATKGGAAPIFLPLRPDLLRGPPAHRDRPARVRAAGRGPRDRKVARRPRVPTRRCGCGWLPRAVSTGNGNVQFFNRDVALAHRRGQQGRAAAPRAAQVRTSAACRSGTAAPQR